MDINNFTMQKYVSQPTEDCDGYVIAKWDETKEEYVPMLKEVYNLEQEAQDRARQLNEENKEQ